MPTLTIEAIRENPWNVTTHTLPENGDPLLLQIAWLAADYCRKSESLLVNAVRQGDYAPPEWRLGDPDAHEYPEGNSLIAERVVREILSRCDAETLAFIDRVRRALPINLDE